MSEKMSMSDYIKSLKEDLKAIKNQPEKGCCDKVETEALESVALVLSRNFHDYDTLAKENSALKTFLSSALSANRLQIEHIVQANGLSSKIHVPMIFSLDTMCKIFAVKDVYSSYPEDISIQDLWEALLRDEEKPFEHEDLTPWHKYENDAYSFVQAQLEDRYDVFMSQALEAITKVYLQQPKVSLHYFKRSVKQVSEGIVAILSGNSDYRASDETQMAWIFNLSTLNDIASCNKEDREHEDSYYNDLNALIDEIKATGCNGLFLSNGDTL